MALFFEAKINTEDRNNLPDSAFGLPSKRKYPLTDKDGNLDEKHILQAVRFFNKADESDKPELAKNILKAAKKLDMDYSNWKDVLKYAGEEDVIKESYTKDLHSTPEADKIFVYLNENVKYDNASPETWRLKSPNELIDHKKGNCHDTAWYVFNKLEEYTGHEVDKGILFFIEYKEGKSEGGQTHSVCYEKIPGGICIIECSWEGMAGTFPYDDIDEYISVVKSKWKFTGVNDKLYATEIKNTSRIHPGMTLGEYVSVAMKNKEIITESYDPQPDDGDHTSGTSDFDNDDKDPDDCFCESGNNVSETQAFYKRWFDNKAKEDLKLAKDIAKRIHEKYEADKQPPCGNQNCQVCVWCAEAQFRGRTDMPRPVYSPRDPVLNIRGESIVIRPQVFSMKAGFDDVLNMLSEHPYARFYCHVKWKESNGGHEFIIITAGENKSYIMDPQQGTVDKFLETHPYIKDLKWEDSYLSRMDNAEFNETVLRDFNTEESIVPWDAKLDIPFMLKEGLLSEEEAEKYWKKHPDEAPTDGMSESKNIFTSGDFDKYGKDADLDDARGPITESKKIIDSRDERTLSRLICEGWKIAGTINNEYILIKEGYEDTNNFPVYVGFRPATEKDLDMILEWTLETINDEYRHDQKVIDMINDENRENINTIKIIVDGIKDIGMYQAYPIDEGEWWYLAEIYLIPEYRGKGIGSFLIKKDIESHDKLVLRVNPDNVRAIKLYESLGFVITEKENNSWIMRLDKTKDGSYQEGYWQDIKNGVNPKSKKLWFHVSFDDKLDEKGPMTPRIPTWLEDIKKDGYTTSDGKKTHDLDEVMRDTGRYENYTTPRVCFSPSIEGALNSIINMWKLKNQDFPGKQLYVYVPEKPLSQYKHKTNKELIRDKEVFDAGTTGESWILEPVKVKFYGSISVDKVKDNGRKHKVLVRPGFEKETDNPMDNYIGRFTYKWHWMIHPSILKQGEKYEKSEKYAQSPLEVCNDIISELKDFKYGIVKDGKLSTSNNSIDDYNKYYKFMTLDEFEKYRGGICYDYVEWEEAYLKDHGKKYKKYYLYADTKNNDTHTFILVKNDNGFIYLESAFKPIEGIYPVKNLQEAVDIITKAMFKMNGNDKLESFNYYIWEYNGHPEYGSSIKQCDEYYTKGEPILEGIAMNPKKSKDDE